jgi:hypothetical protein
VERMRPRRSWKLKVVEVGEVSGIVAEAGELLPHAHPWIFPPHVNLLQLLFLVSHLGANSCHADLTSF